MERRDKGKLSEAGRYTQDGSSITGPPGRENAMHYCFLIQPFDGGKFDKSKVSWGHCVLRLVDWLCETDAQVEVRFDL